MHGAHQHSFLELVFIEQGEGIHRIGGESFEARAGDVFTIAPGQVHDPDGLDSTVHWIIAFERSFLQAQPPNTSFPPSVPDPLVVACFFRPAHAASQFSLTAAQTNRWCEWLQMLATELDARPLFFSDVAQAFLTLILVDLARRIPPPRQGLKPTVTGHIAAAFRVIERDFRGNLQLRDLAREANLSPAYLTDLLKRETGRSALEWVTERRMTEARQMLLATSLSIKEIAHAVGYGDASQFIAHFARFSGTTPKVWRQRNTCIVVQ